MTNVVVFWGDDFLFLFKICLTKCIIMLKLGILFKEKDGRVYGY